MPQSVLKGVGGDLAFTGVVGGFRYNSVEVMFDHDVNDASGFDQWELNEYGQSHISWQAGGVATYGAAADKPFTAAGGPPAFTDLTVTFGPGCTISFIPRMGREAYGGSVRDNFRGGMEGRGSGAPTITWDTGA